jgi:hypothetical protein
MKYLKWYNGDFLGIVGEPTDMTYEDGSVICVGDLVDINIGNEYNAIDLLVTKNGIVGFEGYRFAKGLFSIRGWKYIILKHHNEYLETKTNNISIHEAKIHDIAVKHKTVNEKIEIIKTIQMLNGEKEDIAFRNNMEYNYVFINEFDRVDNCPLLTLNNFNKIIIDYPTFIKHFDNTKLKVEIKQIDNVVLKRLAEGDESLLEEYNFYVYPLWNSQHLGSIEEATEYVENLQFLINSINNPKPKFYDSLAQELHEGDEVEYMVKEAFSQGILSGKLEMFNGKLTIDNFVTLPEEIDNTKFYIRKVIKQCQNK